MVDRVIRMIVAIDAAARVMDGMMKCRQVSIPVAGNGAGRQRQGARGAEVEPGQAVSVLEQILQQAGTAMVAQANQLPSGFHTGLLSRDRGLLLTFTKR